MNLSLAASGAGLYRAVVVSPGATRSRPTTRGGVPLGARHSRLTRIASTSLLITLVTALFLVLFSAHPQEARANIITDALCPARIEGASISSADGGMSRMFGQPGDNPTWLAVKRSVWQHYGSAGVTFTAWSEAGECDPMKTAGTAIANSVLQAVKVVVMVTDFILEQTYNPTWIEELITLAEQVIAGSDGRPGLAQSLYFPMLAMAVFIGSLYWFWTGIVRRQAMQTVQSVLLAVTVVVCGSILMYNPGLPARVSSEVITEAGASLLTGFSSTVSTKSELCTLDANGEDRRTVTQRRTSCELYVMFVLNPWMYGQFGSPDPQVSMEGDEVPLGGGVSVKSLPLHMVDTLTITRDEVGRAGVYDEAKERLDKIRKHMTSDSMDASVRAAWTGDDPWGRVGIASITLLVASVVAILTAVIALDILIAQVIVVGLMIAMPMFLLIAAAPQGRRIGHWYMMQWLGNTLRVVLAMLFLSLAMVLFGGITALMTDTPWAVTILATLVSAGAVFILRSRFMQFLSGMGEGGWAQLESVSKGGASAVVGASMGAVSGAIAGGGSGLVLGMAKGAVSGMVSRRPTAAAVAGASVGTMAGRSVHARKQAKAAEHEREERRDARDAPAKPRKPSKPRPEASQEPHERPETLVERQVSSGARKVAQEPSQQSSQRPIKPMGDTRAKDSKPSPRNPKATPPPRPERPRTAPPEPFIDLTRRGVVQPSQPDPQASRTRPRKPRPKPRSDG